MDLGPSSVLRVRGNNPCFAFQGPRPGAPTAMQLAAVSTSNGGVLVGLLRPGGIIKIGLYSEIARQNILRGRSLIAEKGYSTSPEDIRRCRQDFITMAEDGNPALAKICNWVDFFSLSECRDLLFHVQEHRFTLPQIEEALKSLHLKFLGFEIRDKSTLSEFRKFRQNSNALTSLSLWHDFELENPDTFISMYQFWCKKL